MSALDWWEKSHQHRPITSGLMQAVAALVFVLAPAILFVFDPEGRPTLMPKRFTPEFWRGYSRTFVRLVFWLLGVGTTLFIGYVLGFVKE